MVEDGSVHHDRHLPTNSVAAVQAGVISNPLQFVCPKEMRGTQSGVADQVHSPAADPDHSGPGLRNRAENQRTKGSWVPGVQSETAMVHDRFQTGFGAVVLGLDSGTWIDLKVD